MTFRKQRKEVVVLYTFEPSGYMHRMLSVPVPVPYRAIAVDGVMIQI